MYDAGDDYDFTPSSSTKLASLFDSSAFSNEEPNESLMYVAPKQPRINTTNSHSTEKSIPSATVIIAKVVSLWKLQNSKYNVLGKHGLAIIGSTERNVHELIVYKEKNNLIVRISLANLSFVNQKHNFSSFYDSSGQNWLIKFANVPDQTEVSNLVRKYGAKIATSEPTKVEEPVKVEEPTKIEETVKVEQSTKVAAEDATKTEILNRITKMGQQILPKEVLKSSSTEISDSEQDDAKVEHRIPPRKLKKPVLPEKNNQLIVSSVGNVQFPATSFDPLNFLINQNTELKYALSQMNEKLESWVKESKKNSELAEEKLKARLKVVELQLHNALREQKNVYSLEETIKLQNETIEILKRRCEILTRENLELTTAVELQKLQKNNLEEFCRNKGYMSMEENFQTQNQILDLSMYANDKDARDSITKRLEQKQQEQVANLLQDHMGHLFENSLTQVAEETPVFLDTDVRTVMSEAYKIAKESSRKVSSSD